MSAKKWSVFEKPEAFQNCAQKVKAIEWRECDEQKIKGVLHAFSSQDVARGEVGHDAQDGEGGLGDALQPEGGEVQQVLIVEIERRTAHVADHATVVLVLVVHRRLNEFVIYFLKQNGVLGHQKCCNSERCRRRARFQRRHATVSQMILFCRNLHSKLIFRFSIFKRSCKSCSRALP